MLEESKAVIRSFFEEANKKESTPIELCAPGFTAHI